MTHQLNPREKKELKPCPFCGGETISTHSQDMTKGPAYFWHKCETCGAETEGDFGEADAASMWNRRTVLVSGSGDHAELAALREHRITTDLLVSTLKADKTEAERKLAEADGLLIELAAAPQPKDTGGRFFRAILSINAYVARLNARAFFSKEAERG